MVSGGNPDAPIMPTARALVGSTGASLETARHQVARALVVANFLDDPEVCKADSLTSAMNKVEAKVRRETVALAHSAPLPEEGDTLHTFLEGDCKAILPELPHNSFDLILSDPPYGVGADIWDQGNNQHMYKDTWENAQQVYASILHNGFKLCRGQANLFLFCDPKHFGWLVDEAALAGWRPFMSPIIWKKSTEGQAPWGTKGFIKTHEHIFFATKGDKGLARATLDVLDFSRPDKRMRIHAAQKPVELLTHLINISSLPGDRVLDPCAGSGATFLAGWQTRTAVTGIELDSIYWPHCRKAVMERPSQQELFPDTSGLVGTIGVPAGAAISIEDL
jgi:DNA modification methylase